MKFSELIQSLLDSYKSPANVAPTVSSNTDSVRYSSDTRDTLNKTAHMAEIKTLIHDEIKSELENVRSGPKDSYNSVIANRSTSNHKADVSNINTNGLEQGSWFRSSEKESPYANSQSGGCAKPACSNPSCPQSSGSNQYDDSIPAPFNSNDYIRKDSIPCWGCKLK